MELNIKFDKEALEKSIRENFDTHLQAVIKDKAFAYLNQFNPYLIRRLDEVINNVIYELKKDEIIKKIKAQVNKIKIEFDQSGVGDRSIRSMGFTIKTCNALVAADIETLKDLITKQECELLSFSNIGPKTIFEIQEKLSELGLSLRKGNIKVYIDEDGIDHE